jgi:Flp pilus assembly protein TadD
VDALLAKASARLGAGDAAGAERALRGVLELAPSHAGALHHLGLLAHGAGRTQEGIDWLRRAARAAPADASCRNNLGNLLSEAGRSAEAAVAYREALRLAPDHASARYNLGKALQRESRADEAVACFEALTLSHPLDAQAWTALGAALLDAGRAEEARLAHERALALDPALAEAHNNLGLVYSDLGDFDAAVAAFRAAVARDPGLTIAYVNLTKSRRFDPEQDGDDVERMQALLREPGTTPQQRIDLHFALGKVHDDASRHDEAFEHYRRGNALKRETLAFDREVRHAWTDRLAAAFSAAFFDRERAPGNASELPVLIVGMPRSGTTLVEQIVASHPDAAGAGELPDLDRAAVNLASQLPGESAYPECVRALDAPAAEGVASAYLDALRARGPRARRVTDKMPVNYQHLGLVARVLPGARVVHLRRSPVDVCLSIYFRHFTQGHAYANDLEDVAWEYREYRRLMAHWRSALPLEMLELEYEDLVADQEAQTRRLLEYLGLTFDERCLRFHETRRAVHTASNWQVRQPLYDRSRERWRRYERHLGPLLHALEDLPD